MIHVIATIDVAENQRASVLQEFHQLVPLVRAEAGCIEYGPAVDLATGMSAQPPVRGDTLVVIEKWADLEALKAHLSAPHMVAFRKKIGDRVLKVHLQILEPA
jgi:quinol monooxygenase YgiN